MSSRRKSEQRGAVRVGLAVENSALKNIIFTQELEIQQLRAENWRLQRLVPPDIPKGWLTPKQAAHLLGDVSAPRINQLMKEDRLWWVKIGHNVWIDPASPALK